MNDRSAFIGKASASAVPSFFAGLSPEEVSQVRDLGRQETFAAGETVFQQGQKRAGIHIIEEGEIRSYYTSRSGREITFAYWQKGHYVGGPEILDEGEHSWTGESTRESSLLFIPGSHIRSLIRNIPTFAINAVENVSFKARCFSSFLQLVGTQPIRPLLSHLLLILASTSSQSLRGAIVLDARFTQEALSKMVGATRQWITATLGKMKQDGLIDVVDGHIVIVDLNRLTRFADLDGDAGN
ncbi:MAG: Crp/Fnr family transcriptional regulator [Mesorhizobium sp.]|nr:Crp/Fnr family transcriptional regulator [Mesorhizobium sp.]